MISATALKNSYVGTILKKAARPILPGWVDPGRQIVQGPHLRAMLARVTRDSRGVKTILNAGTGEGLYSDLLFEFADAKRILEIDIKFHGGQQARDARQQFVAASLTALPLPDKSLDLILCSEVLEHIEADELALRELARLSSPRGWLLISVPTPPAVFDPAHVREGYSLEDFSRLLRHHGFELIELRFCMYAFFRLFLRSYRKGVVPHAMVVGLSWLDRTIPLGKPMDLVVLARKMRG